MRGLWLLGQLRAMEGRPRQALGSSETAVALDPDVAAAPRVPRRPRHLSLGFYEAALVASVQALDLDPLWHLPDETRVVCLVRLGRLSEAHAGADEPRQEAPDTLIGRLPPAPRCGSPRATSREPRPLSRPGAPASPPTPTTGVAWSGWARGLAAALRGEERKRRGSPSKT